MKRIIDILGASVGLLLFSPVLEIVAYKIRREMGSPVLFRQKRHGRHGKPFQMIKIRTMRYAIDADGRPLPDAERLTKLGRFLRSSSLEAMGLVANPLHPLSHCNNVEIFFLIVCTKRFRQRNQTFLSLPILPNACSAIGFAGSSNLN